MLEPSHSARSSYPTVAISRRTVGPEEEVYFSPSAPVLSTGSTLLDCALGGGWARNRIINIVGDRSTGKTLLAIEACANFKRTIPSSAVSYIELEAAFDVDYARTVGFPSDVEPLEDFRTIEGIFKFLDAIPEGPRIVVVDSLDAAGAEKDLADALGDHGFGVQKPKLLSEMFMRLVRALAQKQVTLIIISQVRENIGGMGAKYVRSGGKALDFYASQIVWLRQLKKLEKSIEKITRPVGIEVLASCTKNKIGPAFREAPLEILFGYGMDNLHASLYWLKDCNPKRLEEEFGLTPRGLQHRYDRLHDKELIAKADAAVRDEWRKLEERFAIPARKYDED